MDQQTPQRRRRSQQNAAPQPAASPYQGSGRQFYAAPGYQQPMQAPQAPVNGYPQQPPYQARPAAYAPIQPPHQPYPQPAYPPQQAAAPQPSVSRPAPAAPSHKAVPRKPVPKPKRPSGKGKRFNPLWILWILLAAAVIAGTVIVSGNLQREREAAEALQAAVTAYDDRFCEGVWVDGIHLGGMTRAEGERTIRSRLQQRNDNLQIRLIYNQKIALTVTASDLKMTVNADEALNGAWQQGHVGTLAERKAAMEALLAENWYGYTAQPGGDTSYIDEKLSFIKSKLDAEPKNAWLDTFDPTRSDPFVIHEGENGQRLDIEPLREMLYAMVSSMQSGDITIKPTLVLPEITAADIRKNLTLRGTAYTNISTSSTENRNKNIRRACELITGTVLKPGESFSFNKIVGARTEKNGFYEAIEYAYGEHVMGIGGGVCQVSTTIFQAVVAAGLKITSREQHSDVVNYADPGTDATVYYGDRKKIDFVFKNTTDSNIYIVAGVETSPTNKKRLITKVSIYGANMGNITYRLETKVKEIEPPKEPEYVKDKKAEYVTYTDQQKIVSKAAKGYDVEVYIVTYENKKETDRTLAYKDHYDAKAEKIYVGVTKR